MPRLDVDGPPAGDKDPAERPMIPVHVRAVENAPHDLGAIVVPQQQTGLVEVEALHRAMRVNRGWTPIPELDDRPAAPGLHQFALTQGEGQRHVVEKGVAEEIQRIQRRPSPPFRATVKGLATARLADAHRGISNANRDPACLVEADTPSARIVEKSGTPLVRPELRGGWRREGMSKTLQPRHCAFQADDLNLQLVDRI